MVKKIQKIIIGNWKQNPLTEKEAIVLCTVIKKELAILKKKVIIVPPALFLSSISKISSRYIHLGIQNTNIESVGSFTGQFSFSQAKRYTVEYCLVGHSEVRKTGETDTEIAQKVLYVIKEGGIPILCVGEMKRDNTHDYFKYIQEQIEIGLSLLSKKDKQKVYIAYEPVWAIGKNASRALTPEEFYEIKIFIKKLLAEKFGIIETPPILYGGSVTPKNSILFLEEGQADGLLVGRASLSKTDFITIVKQA